MPWKGGVARKPVGSLKRLLGDTGAESQTMGSIRQESQGLRTHSRQEHQG